jgi:protein SDA1
MDVDEDDEAAWDGWDVETDSSEDSSADEGWINVVSDDEPLEVSDDEDNADEKRAPQTKVKVKADEQSLEPPISRISTLATTKVCVTMAYHLSTVLIDHV